MNAQPITLGELIAALGKAKADQPVLFDFCDLAPCGVDSYRGYYDHLAIGHKVQSHTEPVVVAQILAELTLANGSYFTGYKGGEFRMGPSTPVWVANYGRSHATAVTGVFAPEFGPVIITTGYCEEWDGGLKSMHKTNKELAPGTISILKEFGLYDFCDTTCDHEDCVIERRMAEEILVLRQECRDRAECERSLNEWNDELSQNVSELEAERNALLAAQPVFAQVTKDDPGQGQVGLELIRLQRLIAALRLPTESVLDAVFTVAIEERLSLMPSDMRKLLNAAVTAAELRAGR